MLRTQAQLARVLPHPRTRSLAIPRFNSTAAASVVGSENVLHSPTSSPDPAEEPVDDKTFVSRNCSAIAIVKGTLSSIVDAYAIIRAIEQRYGPLREYSFMREYTSFNQYTNRLFVVFESPESRARVPKSDSEIISIPAPIEDTLEAKPGGPSLSDFQTLLAPRAVSTDIPEFGSILHAATNEEDGKADARKRRMIDFTIFQARKEFYTPTQIQFGLKRGVREATGRAMLNWGGFYPIEPITKGTSLEYGVSDADHLRMRRLLRKWSEYTGAPNPFEVSSVLSTSTPTPQAPTPLEPDSSQTAPKPEAPKPKEWEPLPLESAVVDDVPVPIPDVSTTETRGKVSSILPQAPKHAARLGSKLRPSTDPAPGLDADALLKASESVRASEPSPRGDSAQSRRKEKKPKAPTSPPNKKTDQSGFSDRLKRFVGGWF